MRVPGPRKLGVGLYGYHFRSMYEYHSGGYAKKKLACGSEKRQS